MMNLLNRFAAFGAVIGNQAQMNAPCAFVLMLIVSLSIGTQLLDFDLLAICYDYSLLMKKS